MKKNSKKQNMFAYLYDPYAETENDDLDTIYQRYKLDKNKKRIINGITFYHALRIIRTTTRGYALIAALDNEINLKTGDMIIDENGKEYTVGSFGMLRFSNIPEWYLNISLISLVSSDGDVNEVGKYFSKAIR